MGFGSLARSDQRARLRRAPDQNQNTRQDKGGVAQGRTGG